MGGFGGSIAALLNQAQPQAPQSDVPEQPSLPPPGAVDAHDFNPSTNNFDRPSQTPVDQYQQLTNQFAQQNIQQNQPTGHGLKASLQRMAYGFGQAAMKESGLPTDDELQTSAVARAHVQAQTQLAQQQIQQLKTLVPVTLPNGTSMMVPQAIAGKLLPAQVAAQSRVGVAQLGADSRKTIAAGNNTTATKIADARNKTALQIAQERVTAGQNKPNEIQLIMRANSGDKAAQDTLRVLQGNREKVRAAGAIAGADERAKTTPFSTYDDNGVPTTISNMAAVNTGAPGINKQNLGTSMGKAALLGDIRGGLQQVREYADVFDDPASRAKISILTAQPGITTQTLLQSPIAASLASSTDPKDMRTLAAVTQILNLKENAMAMRSVLGAGQGSEDLRRAIQQTIPGAATGSGKQAGMQLDTFGNTLDRLERGIPKLGAATNNALGKGNAPAANLPAKGTVKMYNGVPYMFDGTVYRKKAN